MDTDVLLQPVHNEHNQVDALKDVIKANTAAFKEIRLDLADCNNVDKVRAIITKTEKAMEDLSIDSQKLPPWVRAEPVEEDYDPYLLYGTMAYGQYPISDPIHPHNPVPRADDMVPPVGPPTDPDEPLPAPPGGAWMWIPPYGWCWVPGGTHPVPSSKGAKK